MKLAGLETLFIKLLKDNKEAIVDGINKKVNLPLISEAREEDIFDALFDGFVEIVEEVMKDK